MFGNKFKKRDRVYIKPSGKYGKVEMIRGGLIKVTVEGSNTEIWVKPDEIRKA